MAVSQQWDDSQAAASAAPSTPATFGPQSLAHSISLEPTNGLTRRQFGQQKRLETIQRNKDRKRREESHAEAAARAEQEAARVQQEAERFRQAQAAQAIRIESLRRILASLTTELRTNGFDFGDLLVYAFDPFSSLGDWRWDQFWRCPDNFSQLMRHWLSPWATESGRKLFKGFAIDLVTRTLRHEAQQVTSNGCLKTPEATAAHTTGKFALEMITSDLHKHCPTTLSVLNEFCTASAQRRKNSCGFETPQGEGRSISYISTYFFTYLTP
jgi:hypothetical protein